MSSSTIERCIFCLETLPGPTSLDSGGDFYSYYCLCCGYVKASGTCAVFEQTEDHRYVKDRRHLISGVLRWRSIRKNTEYRTILFDDIPKIIESSEIPAEIPDKADKLIEYFGLSSLSFGHVEVLDHTFDRSITFSPRGDEFRSLVNYLHNEKILLPKNDPAKGDGQELSMLGWRRYRELQKTAANEKQCFIAMNFDDAYDPILQKIKEAVLECKLEPYCVKGLQSNDQITDLIIAGIKKSKFLVADFSGNRPSVYYEAGFAKGLGKQVICLGKKGTKPHFDTRQYNHIFWMDGEDLKKQLIQRIEATII